MGETKTNGTKQNKTKRNKRKWPDDAIPLAMSEEEQIRMLSEYLKDRFVNPEIHGTNKPDLIIYVTPKVKS